MIQRKFSWKETLFIPMKICIGTIFTNILTFENVIKSPEDQSEQSFGIKSSFAAYGRTLNR